MSTISLKRELTEKEIIFLRDNIDKLTYKELGKILNISSTTVIKKCKELRIIRQKDALRGQNFGFYEDRIEDYDLYRLRVKKVIEECKSGKIETYRIVKMYKDKALMIDKMGHRVCLTYQELALNRNR